MLLEQRQASAIFQRAKVNVGFVHHHQTVGRVSGNFGNVAERQGFGGWIARTAKENELDLGCNNVDNL